MFSLCLLLYGDHPELAKRCLHSLAPDFSGFGHVADLRIGCNDISEATRRVLYEYLPQAACQVPVTTYHPERNVGKYPLMRRMFYDTQNPLDDFVLWLDDDSYLQNSCSAWWESLANTARRADVVGECWRMPQQGRQFLAVRQQPWYTGQPLDENHFFRFATGGFWVGRTEFLRRWDYPFPEIHHNGGDSILGELVRQQGNRLVDFRNQIAVNQAERRGIAKRRSQERRVWVDYHPARQASLAHHEFSLVQVKWNRHGTPKSGCETDPGSAGCLL